MKRLIYVAVMALIFMGCKPPVNPANRLPDGWLPMPEEQIKSYIPVNEGDVVTYISENNETMLFRCCTKTYRYHPYYAEYEDDGQNGNISGYAPYDEVNAGLDFISTSENSRGNKMIMEVSINIYGNRTLLDIIGGVAEADIGSGGAIRLEFENDPKKSQGMGWPKYPNEFMQYLTDEIQLPDKNGNIAAVLKAGKGLIWFTDYTGVKWYLQE